MHYISSESNNILHGVIFQKIKKLVHFWPVGSKLSRIKNSKIYSNKRRERSDWENECEERIIQ